MMMGPESYYEFHLKGKTPEQLQSAIRSLKREIGHLKNILEDPDDSHRSHICPDESVRLWCCREYLERAKKALTDAGGEYKPTRAEIAAENFDRNIPAIRTFRLRLSSWMFGDAAYTATVDGESVHVDTECFPPAEQDSISDYSYEPETKEDFLEDLRRLHMGEWRHSYDTERYGIDVFDGTQWEVEITYTNGHKPVRFCGSNAFPFSFERLTELFGVPLNFYKDDTEEEDSE